jgi:hypothetical protein
MLYVVGAIHMSLIDDVRRRKGVFFQSCQPDIFSSVALSCITERYAYSHEPFALAGHSRHSNGASWSASGKGAKSNDALKANQTFSSEANIPWHADIPTLPDGKVPFSADLLVYESYLQTMHLHDNALGLNHREMLALFLARNIEDRERMAAWGELFAQKHGLDLAEGRRRAAALRLRVMRDRVLQNAAAFRDFYRLEPRFGVKMRDVYEASVVAATILKTRPGRLRSYAGTLAKRLGLPQPVRA